MLYLKGFLILDLIDRFVDVVFKEMVSTSCPLSTQRLFFANFRTRLFESFDNSINKNSICVTFKSKKFIIFLEADNY